MRSTGEFPLPLGAKAKRVPRSGISEAGAGGRESPDYEVIGNSPATVGGVPNLPSAKHWGIGHVGNAFSAKRNKHGGSGGFGE